MQHDQKQPPLVLVVGKDRIGGLRRCSELNLGGCCATYVDDFLEALALVRASNVGLVLLMPPVPDFVATDLPGLLREIVPQSYLPILMQAPLPGQSIRCDYLRAGADDVLAPDASREELCLRAGALLRLKQRVDELERANAVLSQSLQRERKRLLQFRKDNASLQELCTTDPLTRLQNARSFWDILEHEFRMAKRYNQPLSLLMLDVDHFKLVNDLYGHPSGDFVLKELAVILKRSVRESDVVARTGGEEFGVILPRADVRRAAVLAERIRREVGARRFDTYGRSINVTISIGSASYPADPESTEPRVLAFLADQALLRAKESGRDRVVALHSLEGEVRARLRRQCVHPSPVMEQEHAIHI